MTQQYVGTKIITAWEADKDGAPGYSVKYSDGYVSWSPADVFEAAYIPLGHIDQMPPHQQRVIAEKAELDKKAHALSEFIGNSPTFETLDSAEQERLKVQNDVMWQYSEVLAERIAAFTPPTLTDAV